MMKIRPQITSVEVRIRIPAWRSASPKKRSTLSENTSPTIFEQNLTISPADVTQSRGTASQPISGSSDGSARARAPVRVRGESSEGPLLDHRDLGVGCQQ